MALTKEDPSPTNLPSHRPASSQPRRTRNRPRPIYDDPLLDFPFALIDYSIVVTQELDVLFREAIRTLWSCILLYSLYTVAPMLWRNEQEDWL
jgi:hypothetical protein